MTLYNFYVIILLISPAFSYVDGEIDISEDLVYCCRQGFSRANKKRSCTLQATSLSLVDHVCLITAALCCHQKVREQACNDGWEHGKDYDSECYVSRKRNSNFVRCCEACKAGLYAKRLGDGACKQISKLHIDQLWQSVFLSCCNGKTQSRNFIVAEGLRDMCKMLPGELCAHRCVSTGVGTFTCHCNPGYFLMSDGKSCSRCEDCKNGCTKDENNRTVCTPTNMALANDKVSCVPKTDPQKWHCPHGYRHDDISNKCRDIDECLEQIDDCEDESHDCVNMIGSYNCIPKIRPITCQSGFNFSLIHGTCEDIDECSNPDDPPCDSNQDCQNTIGNYECNCKSGYYKDPILLACVDINECQENTHNCSESQRCDNAPGSYQCIRTINCGTGYTLNTNSGVCEDDDECRLKNACKFLGEEWECKNIQGSFRCIRNRNKCTSNCQNPPSLPFTPIHDCPSGYRFDGSACRDINECDEGISRCGEDLNCVNINGSYFCSDKFVCREGLKLNKTTSVCDDVNECEQEGMCQHICQNTWASYRCLCRNGYLLDGDQRSCIDVDECEFGTMCQGYCLNTEGSYTCQCPPGYRLGKNKYSCHDVNECESSPGVCQGEDEVCFNFGGSYRCNKIVCPPGYTKDPRHKSKCLLRNLSCREEDYECRLQPRSYIYSYISMPSNYTIPIEGFIRLYAIESSWKTALIEFNLDLVKVNAEPGVPKATINDFYLEKQYGRALLQLLNPLIGPQQIFLELSSVVYNSRYPIGNSISHIEVYVSRYPY